MDQQPLFFEDIYDALKFLVQSCGGAKKVGAQIYPKKPVEQAARTLLDTLNDDRREKLDPEQLLQLLAIGREHECHAAVNFISRHCGYSEPDPINPQDQAEKDKRELIELLRSVRVLEQRLLAREGEL